MEGVRGVQVGPHKLNYYVYARLIAINPIESEQEHQMLVNFVSFLNQTQRPLQKLSGSCCLWMWQIMGHK